MIERFLEKRIGENIRDDRVRSAYGRAASLIGVGANVLLFVLKMIVGMISGSVAITADAVNNLSDASSSIVSLMGFRLASKPADADHPYGHGRVEYLAGLMVAVMILVIGVELLKSSIEKILAPQAVQMSWALIAVLVGSILVKLWLTAFNRKIGRKIGSTTLMATAQDSSNDVIATTAVLVSAVIAHLTGWMLDGWMGAAVAVFILVSGFALVRETINPMLGMRPSREFVESVRRKLESYPGVLGTHDLMVHDYGPGRQFASVHLEMDAAVDPMASHDLIDSIERDFLAQEQLHMVIHYDPVTLDDPRLNELRALAVRAAEEIHPRMSVHDVRIVRGSSHTKVVFDCVVPYDLGMDGRDIRKRIDQAVRDAYSDCFCVITLEHGYIHG